MINYIKTHKAYFDDLSRETYLALEVLLGLPEAVKKYIKRVDTGREVRYGMMCEALLDYYQDGVNEGIEKGIKGFVQTLKELNIEKDVAVSKAEKNFKIDKDVAVKLVEKYW